MARRLLSPRLGSPAGGAILSPRSKSFRPDLQALVGSAVITLGLWRTSQQAVTLAQGLASYLLLLFAWWSYRDWKKGRSPGLPLFSFMTMMYWVFFGVSLFWGDRWAPDWRFS